MSTVNSLPKTTCIPDCEIFAVTVGNGLALSSVCSSTFSKASVSHCCSSKLQYYTIWLYDIWGEEKKTTVIQALETFSCHIGVPTDKYIHVCKYWK